MSFWRVQGAIIGPKYMLPKYVVPPTTTGRLHTGHSAFGFGGRDARTVRDDVGLQSQDHPRRIRPCPIAYRMPVSGGEHGLVEQGKHANVGPAPTSDQDQESGPAEPGCAKGASEG